MRWRIEKLNGPLLREGLGFNAKAEEIAGSYNGQPACESS